MPKALDMNVANEESMDGPSSVDQSLNDTSSYQGDSVADNTPTSSKKKKVVACHINFHIQYSLLKKNHFCDYTLRDHLADAEQI